MTTLILPLICFLASCLTFYTGFGLSTILMPFVIPYIGITKAIILVAILHLGNNLLKFGLNRHSIDLDVVRTFALTAIPASYLGAYSLLSLNNLPTINTIEILGKDCSITVLKLVLAFLILALSFFELITKSFSWRIPNNYILLGGLLSGFIGGLSGHQGALRSIFLTNLISQKEKFIASSAALAILVDLTRLSFYLPNFFESKNILQISSLESINYIFSFIACIAGTLVGQSLLPKLKMHNLEKVILFCLILLSISLAIGLI